MNYLKNKTIFSWALYDWANSAYATVVLAGFFPLFFKQYWSNTTDVTTSTFQLGVANSLASTIIVILAPILGAIADAGNHKKRLLFIFASLGIVMTGGFYFVTEGQMLMALTLFTLSAIGFSGSVIFYDALIVGICEQQEFDHVSSFGFALGYLGGGVLFAFNVYMTLQPEMFGLEDKAEAIRLSFLSVAIWWAVFSIPLFLNVPEAGGRSKKTGMAIRLGFKQLKHTIQQLKKLKMIGLFLLAYWLYIDGVDTIVRMAVDYGMAIGFDATDLITALLITQFVGFPSAILFGYLAQYIGAKKGIMSAIVVYLCVTVWASQMQQVYEFYLLAMVIGLVQGGIQALSRSFYARLIPAGQAAEFFGFYNMLGKFAAVLGPILIGSVSVLSGSPRVSILSISIFFVVGAVLLFFVDEAKARRMLDEYQAN